MKLSQTIFLFFSFLFLALMQGQAQTQTCINLSSYNNAYLSTVSTDHTTYPAGSAFIQTGDIRYVKPNTTSPYQFINGDTLCYIGKIEINVATASYAQRKLRFGSMFTLGLVIDGDTVFSNNNPLPVYNGNGFTVQYSSPWFTITGAFDTAHIFGSTNCIYTACLEPYQPNSAVCWDLSGLTQTLLNTVTADHTLYPAGSVFHQTGDIRIVKPSTSPGNIYMNAHGDTLCYVGKIEFNVATAAFSPRTLTFNSMLTQGLIVDGDTIFQTNNPPALYNGSGFTVSYSNNAFTIQGVFDTVHIFGSTNCISAVCLSPLTPSNQTCLDFSGLSNQDLSNISTNHTTYPAGSTIYQSGDVKLIKPETSSIYMSINGDTLCYIGKIEFQVTSAPFTQRKLVFNSIIFQGMVVDGDTVFQSNNPPVLYTGSGFTVAHAVSTFTIRGVFDTVHIFGSTNCISGICLSPDTVSNQTCLDYTGTTNQYINDISNDDTTYPAGSTVFQTGNIRMIKSSVLTTFIYARNDSMCYIGNLDINISTAPFTQRKLTFETITMQGLVIDGDTVFNNWVPLSSHNGPNYSLTQNNNHYTISGTFDTVHIFGSTNCLYAICLEDISTSAENDIIWDTEFLIYPNPGTGQFKFKHQLGEINWVKIYTAQGSLMYSGENLDRETEHDFSIWPAGMYILVMENPYGARLSERIIIQK